MKLFVVRFFDAQQFSQQTHDIWAEVHDTISTSQIYRSVISHQIQCDADPLFCQIFQISDDLTPEILIFKENKVAAYFSQKHDFDEFNYVTIIDFIDSINQINPFEIHRPNPKVEVEQVLGIV